MPIRRLGRTESIAYDDDARNRLFLIPGKECLGSCD